MAKKDKIIVYVTRDIERALGKEPSHDYRIICNKNAYAEQIRSAYPDFVTTISETPGKTYETSDILKDKKTNSVIETLKKDNDVALLVFKNSGLIREISRSNNWDLLNPSNETAEIIENKITQIEWLGDLGEKYLPPHSVSLTKEIKWNDEPFILQWPHGHTGDGTILIRSKEDLDSYITKFPERSARITTRVNGPSFTVNAVVGTDKIVIGNISYQITGINPFTDNAFSTIGNDWSVPFSLLSESEVGFIETMIREIGEKLRDSGWKGLFGLDLMRDDERNRIYLIEINARQPASTPFESQLQAENRGSGLGGSTIFEAHLDALENMATGDNLIPINDGAQIVQRITNSRNKVDRQIIQKLEAARYRAIEYQNVDHNADLVRIQSARGIMESHNKFNARGKEISSIINGESSDISNK